MELPWHLFLSPDEFGRWHHRTAPPGTAISASTFNRVSIGYRPLWHTRLWRFAPVQAEPAGAAPAPDVPPVLRAIWSPEFGEWQASGRTAYPVDSPPPHYPLKKADLVDLVRAMSDVGTSTARTPAESRNLMLTSQGGWLDAKGEWDLGTLDLGGWTHKATLGRDQYVRVARKGFLYPFGHRCARIDVTERKIVQTPVGRRAFLLKQTFLVVKEPVKEFSGDSPTRRRFPFRRIRIVTTASPGIDTVTALVPGGSVDSAGNPIAEIPAEQAFFPYVSGKPFLFDIEATDWAGNVVAFPAHLAFFGEESNGNYTKHRAMQSAYTAKQQATAIAKPVSFADEGTVSGSTSLHSDSMYFTTEIPSLVTWNLVPRDRRVPHFSPTMFYAWVRSSELSEIAGTNVPAKVKYYPGYATSSFEPTGRPGEVFLQMDPPMGIDLSGSRSGGVASPRLRISGFSRTRGPVCGDASTFDGGQFVPSSYFGPGPAESSPVIPDPKLLGLIPLKDVIPPGAGLDQAPTVSSELVDGVAITRMRWEYQWSPGPPVTTAEVFESNAGAPSYLTLTSEIRRPSDGSASTQVVSGELRNFAIVFAQAGIEFVRVAMDRLAFRSATGESTWVDPSVREIKFGGPLNILARLAEIASLASAAGSPPALTEGPQRAAAEGTGGPSVSVTGAGIEVTNSLMIPNIAVGYASLVNIDFGTKFTLPFTDAGPGLELSFGSIERPFGVSAMALAGFGYFGLKLSTAGLERIQASMELGAMVAVNFGVASGVVSASFGMMFSRDMTKGIALDAHFRISGSVRVLGLVTVSIDMYLALEWHEDAPCKLTGRATLAVKVKVAFFSKTVRLSVDKSFEGSDPKFEQMMSSDDWTDYCRAFAPVPAGA